MADKTATAAPRFQRIPRVLKERDHSRTGLYRLAGEHAGLFRKSGRSILVDTELLDQIEAALPSANIKADPSRPVPVTAAALQAKDRESGDV
jgi:hypothetical protein